ncbi:cytochrome P450 [Microthyrium microscopicum]|uniref:Cytochrome P450 n=1 Tax=Microthyrium microscopicum TaxID=703497 RepID=A0A6A6UPP7_9PEZI|nr:cytochrome P450 [Microthyrium microscopicum]
MVFTSTTLVWLPIGIVIFYVSYQRLFHPLAKFKGPFLASLTGYWRVYHELKGDLPQTIYHYHQRYGQFVRVAPNEISTISPDFVDVVLKGGPKFIKSSFYDGSGDEKPNIFNVKNEALHKLRHRQMAPAFSVVSLTKMEYIFDRHAFVMIKKLDQIAKSGRPVDLTEIFKFFAHDTNGELSFSKQYHLQEQGKLSLWPPMNVYIIMGNICGYVPGLFDPLQKLGPFVPYLRKFNRSRDSLVEDAMKNATIEFEKRRVHNVEATFEDKSESRINLLTSLVMAQDPESGEMLDLADIAKEAISFVVAGSHSTSASMSFLFAALLRYPEILKKVQDEIKASMSLQDNSVDLDGEFLPSWAGLQSKLPYLSAVLKESFRLYPTVNQPLARVIPPSGVQLEQTVFSSGTIISASAYVVGRNQKIWGANATDFKPDRWLSEDARGKDKYLLHFGQGHRSCIAKNQALITLWKGTVAILQRFKLSPVDREGEQRVVGEIQLNAQGFAEPTEPLLVTISEQSRCMK